MNVVFVYKYLTLGGVETVLRARLEMLPQFGIEASAWFLMDGPGRPIFQGCEAKIRIGPPQALTRYLQTQPTDLVLTLDTEEILPVLGSTVPVVVESHTPYLENLEYLRLLQPKAVTAFLVPSALQADRVRARTGTWADIRVVPNPLHPLFSTPLQHAPLHPTRPVVAWFGRLDALKNWRQFIKVAEHLASDSIEVEFWLVGTGVEANLGLNVYDLARRAGILPRLRWFKGVTHQFVPAFLDAIRGSGGAVVSTSRGESFGMTVAEALARACPVVVPRQEPFTEYVADLETGLLYEAGDSRDAAQKIRQLLADSVLRDTIGQQGRARILARHSADAASRQLAKQLLSFVPT